MSKRTVPQGEASAPINGLRVRVVAGPDAGLEATAEQDTLSIGTANDNRLVLGDETVSRYHLELRTLGDRIELTDLGSTNATFVGGTRVDRGRVTSGTEITIGRTRIVAQSLDSFDVPLSQSDQLQNLLGRSTSMRKLLANIERVAGSDASVLLVGETGVGKEAVAQALHDASARNQGPFEIVDCGVLAPSLVASELFGHERGAFTGAESRRVGAFERADGGTIFLDEIGELPSGLQSSLLGALERRSFKRLGGNDTIRTNVRVISATNRDLRAEVNAGRFRQDLYYRLAVVTLSIPPLRERTDDIPLLAEHFLREAGHNGDPEGVIPGTVMRQLVNHQWPGNVRELRNFVEAALALGAEGVIEQQGLDGEPASPSPAREAAGSIESFKTAREKALADFEQRYLTHLLEEAHENVSKAARISGMHRSYLNALLKKHRLR